jgi:hypothetical protein
VAGRRTLEFWFAGAPDLLRIAKVANRLNQAIHLMKAHSLVGIIVATTAWCHAQEEVPAQVRSARAGYENAVKAAVDPVRLRYLEELDRMRSTAMSQKKLDVANAIDAELTAAASQKVITNVFRGGQAEAKIPVDLRAARNRYNTALKGALEPIKARHIAELKVMQATALSQKNLDLANAFDAELTVLTGDSPNSPEGLEELLSGSLWTWSLPTKVTGSTLRFLPNGTYMVNNTTMGKWSVVDNSTAKFENGSRLTFSKDYKSYQATTPAGNRVGKRLGAK